MRLLVAGELRPCPREWWDALLGPKPPEGWDGCNGCTGAPDELWGFTLWPACYIHDAHYAGIGNVPRFLADLIFRVNLWRLVRMQGGTRLQAVAIAGPYWLGVMIGGVPHYKRG